MRSYGRTLIVCLLLIAAFGLIGFFVAVKTPYKNIVLNNSEMYSVEPELIYAVINVESSFNEKAVSGAGAVGLMQVLPSTAEWIIGEQISQESLFDPEINIGTGVKYLAYLFTQFDELWQVLAAYNAGETKVKVWIEDGIDKNSIPYTETSNYVKKVERLISVYKFRLFYLN